LFRRQVGLEDRFEYHQGRHLHHAVTDRRYPQRYELLQDQGLCDGHPLEFVIVDNASFKVLVQDGEGFRQPAAGTLLGTITNLKTKTPVARERVLLEGHLKRGGLLTYEVAGKKYYADGIDDVEITLPSGTRFNLWSD
jgi:hypothetical protein